MDNENVVEKDGAGEEEKNLYDVHDAAEVIRVFVNSKEMADRNFHVDRIANTYVISQMTKQNIFAYIQENGISIKRLEFKNLMEAYGSKEVTALLEHTYP